MANHLYRVERHMLGDKPYVPGDQRELSPGDAAHLVRNGVLTDLGPVKAPAEAKADPKPKNKAEPAVQNKEA